jgi:hypothetical protein
MNKPQTGTPHNPNPDYQDRDILIKPIVYFIIGMAVLTLLSVLGMAWFLQSMESKTLLAEAEMTTASRERSLPPGPRLLADEKANLEAYLENARNLMDSYGISADAEDKARIPVSKAIEIVAGRGLPRWPATLPVQQTESDPSLDQSAEDVSSAEEAVSE